MESSEDPTPQIKTKAATQVEWSTFLESHPPDKFREILNGTAFGGSGPIFTLLIPDLHLHCSSDVCNGVRVFECDVGRKNFPGTCSASLFLKYVCKNCGKTRKEYALLIKSNVISTNIPNSTGKSIAFKLSAMKFGEFPPLGPVSSRKLEKLIGDDHELFKLGLRAEGSGMGIGAFAYYRRVVENQRTKLFNKLILAAERLKCELELIQKLKDDRDNWRFSNSLASLKSALPDSLRIQGHNPIALLHNALSHKIHNESDEQCLELAMDIRQVLTFVAEQLDSILKDQSELEKAVGRLSRKPVSGMFSK